MGNVCLVCQFDRPWFGLVLQLNSEVSAAAVRVSVPKRCLVSFTSEEPHHSDYASLLAYIVLYRLLTGMHGLC